MPQSFSFSSVVGKPKGKLNANPRAPIRSSTPAHRPSLCLALFGSFVLMPLSTALEISFLCSRFPDEESCTNTHRLVHTRTDTDTHKANQSVFRKHLIKNSRDSRVCSVAVCECKRSDRCAFLLLLSQACMYWSPSDCLDVDAVFMSLKFRLYTLSALFSYVSNENEINLFLFHFSILLFFSSSWTTTTRFRDVDERKTVFLRFVVLCN